MAKFDRKVERTKKEYQFTVKTNAEKDKGSLFRDNFSLRWIKLNLQTVLLFVLAFMLVTLVVIPVLSIYIGVVTAFVLGHGLITSLIIVLTVCFLRKEKPSLQVLAVRYLFLILLLGVSAYLSMVLSTWFG